MVLLSLQYFHGLKKKYVEVADSHQMSPNWN